jgi:TusE/DsrC/DsvC family sulfur relay protein
MRENAFLDEVVQMSSLLDEQGFLFSSSSWNRELAEKIAIEQIHINLTEKHWTCIYFVREYYGKWETMPMIKAIRENSGLTIDEFELLFKADQSSARGVLCKIAGLPRLLCISAGC